LSAGNDAVVTAGSARMLESRGAREIIAPNALPMRSIAARIAGASTGRSANVR
jgi:hypothetical protein